MLPTHKRAALALALTTAIAVVGAALTAAPASAAAAPGTVVHAATAASPEQQVFTLINKERTARGLRPLVGQTTLNSTAEAWAKHLATTGTFQHSTASWRLSRIGLYGWRASGENLAGGFTSPTAAVTAWMKSAGHRANILATMYKGMGIGFYRGGPYGYYWAVVFAVADPPMPKGTTPRVTGAREVGHTLTAKTSGWPRGTVLKWRWYRNGVAIGGATKSTYRATKADKGKSLQAKVTAYNPRYYFTSKSSTRTSRIAP